MHTITTYCGLCYSNNDEGLSEKRTMQPLCNGYAGFPVRDAGRKLPPPPPPIFLANNFNNSYCMIMSLVSTRTKLVPWLSQSDQSDFSIGSRYFS